MTRPLAAFASVILAFPGFASIITSPITDGRASARPAQPSSWGWNGFPSASNTYQMSYILGTQLVICGSASWDSRVTNATVARTTVTGWTEPSVSTTLFEFDNTLTFTLTTASDVTIEYVLWRGTPLQSAVTTAMLRPVANAVISGTSIESDGSLLLASTPTPAANFLVASLSAGTYQLVTRVVAGDRSEFVNDVAITVPSPLTPAIVVFAAALRARRRN